MATTRRRLPPSRPHESPAVTSPAPTRTPTLAATETVAATPAPASITIEIGPGRDGGQTGSATLTAQDGQTLVVVNIQAGPVGVAQPAHIHLGSCPNVGDVALPLTAVVDGTSTTTVDAALDLLRDGNHAINVHMSGAEAGVYVACGNIPAAS